MTDRKPWREAVALFLVLAVMNLYSASAMGSVDRTVPLGNLSAVGEVTVNGAAAITGASVFAGSDIATAQNSSAVVSLGRLGQVQLLESTGARVAYGDSQVASELGGGGLRASVPQGVAARVDAGALVITSDPREAASLLVRRDGDAVTVTAQTGRIEVRDGDKTLSLSAGGSYANAAAPQGGNNGNGNKKDRFGLIILGIGAAVAAIIFVVTRRQNQSTQIGGGNQGPSPTS